MVDLKARASVREAGACRTFRLRRAAAGMAPGDLVVVHPGTKPEGGELVIDMRGRLGRHGGGPVLGVVVAIVRQRVLPPGGG